jgi:DNA mismatch endonuclease Vsr
MPDIFIPEKRASIMRSVRNKNTLPELIIQSLLRDIGVEYEREKELLNCRPDIIIKDIKKVIFINGCFGMGIIVNVDNYQRQIDSFGREK